MSVPQEINWKISGCGVRTYQIKIKSLSTGAVGNLLYCAVDYTYDEP